MESSAELFLDEEESEAAPELDDEWLTNDETEQHRQRECSRTQRKCGRAPDEAPETRPTAQPEGVQDDSNNDDHEPPPVDDAHDDSDNDDNDDDHQQQHRQQQQQEGLQRSGRQCSQNPRCWNDGIAQRRPPGDAAFTFCTAKEHCEQRKWRLHEHNNACLMSPDWTQAAKTTQSVDVRDFIARQEHMHQDPATGEWDCFDPLMLMTKADAEDNPRWHEAMNGPHAEEFLKACDVECNQLLSQGTWDVVDREEHMSAISSVWAFKIKRFPSGPARKFKA